MIDAQLMYLKLGLERSKLSYGSNGVLRQNKKLFRVMALEDPQCKSVT